MHRRTVLVVLASLAFLGCAKKDSSAEDQLRALTVDQVSDRIAAKDGKTFVFDNNRQETWVKGHVPTAKWVDQDHVTAGDLPPDHAAALIFYCHNES